MHDFFAGDQMYPIYSGPPLEKFATEARTPQFTGHGECRCVNVDNKLDEAHNCTSEVIDHIRITLT